MITEKTIEKVTSQWMQDQYAFYLRKSRADLEMEALGEMETLTRHKHMLDALAAKHDIHPDQITVYKELVSGDSISERVEMQRLLVDVYKKKYKGVLVVEVERLARGNTKDQGEVAEAFQSSDTKIITPMKVYNPNDEFDQEYFEFGLFMSRREYKTIKRRLVAGKNLSAAEGNYMLPQRIYGYDIVRTSKKDRYLVIKPEEAKIVKMIFDWYTEDLLSVGQIAKKLTLMGIRTMKGKPEWNRGTVRDMLNNVHYTGRVWWNRHNTVKEFDQDTGKLVKVRKANEEPDIYEGKQEAIISMEQFEKVKQIDCRPATNEKVQTELVNPLAGLMKCCDCGRNILYCSFGKDVREPRFQHARSTLCKKKSLPADQVIAVLLEALKANIRDFELKMESDHNDTESQRHAEILAAMEAELAKKERKRTNLFNDYEDGTYTRDEFIERKLIYNQAIDELKKQIQEAKKSAPEPVDYSEQIVRIHAIIDCINDPEKPAKAKNDFLKQFIDKITYDAIDYGRKKGGLPIFEVFWK